MLTGIGGEPWRAAAQQLGIPIATFTIGPAGRDAQDIYGDRYSASEIEEDGYIVVRPDMHVAWRSPTLVADPHAVFARLLG